MKKRFADMTWIEVRACATRNPWVIIPVGTTEQHGPQTPVGADNYVAEEIADRVSVSTKSVVLPTIPLGYSPTFRNVPGTLSIEPETLKAVIHDLVTSCIRHGFQKFLFVMGHSGNSPLLDQAVRKLKDSHSILVGAVYPWRLARFPDLYEDGSSDIFGHGGEPVASVLLRLRPNAFRKDLAEKGQLNAPKGLNLRSTSQAVVDGKEVQVFYNIGEVTENNAIGDGRVADEERGEEILRRVSAIGVKFLTQLEEANPGFAS